MREFFRLQGKECQQKWARNVGGRNLGSDCVIAHSFLGLGRDRLAFGLGGLADMLAGASSGDIGEPPSRAARMASNSLAGAFVRKRTGPLRPARSGGSVGLPAGRLCVPLPRVRLQWGRPGQSTSRCHAAKRRYWPGPQPRARVRAPCATALRWGRLPAFPPAQRERIRFLRT